MTELILNEKIHERVFHELIPGTQEYLWILTADIKNLHLKKNRRFVPFLEVLSDLLEKSVSVRLFHAKEPGPRFRKDFDRFPALVESDNFERILCPRLHTKAIISDGKKAFIGSANLTGAGLGAKSPLKRNFEAGFLTDETEHLHPLLTWADSLYHGDLCKSCQRRSFCPDPIA